MIRGAITVSLLLSAAALVASQDAQPAPRKKDQPKKEGAVSLNIEQVAQKAVATLSASEKASSVVYLDSHEVKAGESAQVGREQVTAPWDAMIAFVDLEPAANWGHSCRYLLVNTHTGAIQSFDASTPPFLKAGPSKTLRVVWKGERVPDWALAVR